MTVLASQRPEYASRVGLIAMAWAYTEVTLRQILAGLARAEAGYYHAITENVSVQRLIEVTRLTSNVRLGGTELTELAGILDHLDELRGDRNRYIHGIWDFTGEAATVMTFRWDRQAFFHTLVVTLTELNEAVAEIENAALALDKLGHRLGLIEPL